MAGPPPKNATVSEQMSRMPRAGTTVELRVRRALHAKGLRFGVTARSLPGTPDIVFPRAKLAVFIDGCFWHGCPDHGVVPKNNRQWWEQKLAGTRERDARKDAQLRELGWLPVHFREHETVEAVVTEVERLWRERTGRSAFPT